MASRFSTKDVARWRKRLLHAKKVWDENGLLASGSKPSLLRMGIEMYRGNHLEAIGDFGGLEDEDIAISNKIFSTGNAILAKNAARNPSVQIFPRSPRAQDSAPYVEALLNYDMQELSFKRVLNQALLHHLFAPYGITRHGFTPREETFDKEGKRIAFYRAAKPDRPWIETRPIWEVLWDPASRGLCQDGGTRWVAFQNLMTVDQIQRNPGMIARKDLRPSLSSESLARLRSGSQREMSPDDLDLVEVWTIYEVEERTWTQITLDGMQDKPLREPEDWPIPWEWLPVNGLGVNEQMDSAFPIPILQEAIPVQIELDKVRTMMSLLARNIRRIGYINENGMDENEIAKIQDGALMEWFRGKLNANEAIAQIQSGGFPQELILYSQILEQDIREATGQGLMDRAQRINVESATEAANVQQGSDVLALRIQSAFEDFAGEVIRTYMQARRATMVEEELVPILSPQDAASAAPVFLTVDPAALHEEYDYRVVPGSMLSPDHDREAAKAAADLQFAASMPELHNMPRLIADYWIARGKDPNKVMTKPEERQQVRDRLTQGGGLGQEGEANGRGGGVDPMAFAFGGNQ